jgi:small conductance mechanosensitive channel
VVQATIAPPIQSPKIFDAQREVGERFSLPSAAIPQTVEDYEAVSLDELQAQLVPKTEQELAVLAEQFFQAAKQRSEDVLLARSAIRLLDSEEPEDRDIDAENDEAFLLVGERNLAFQRLTIVLDKWEERNGDRATIETYRAYRRAVFSGTLEALSPQGTWLLFQRWAVSSTGGVKLLRNVGFFFAAFLAILLLAFAVKRVVAKLLHRTRKKTRLLNAFVSLAAFWFVILTGLVVIISSIGWSITPVFAVFGGASFILAFAMQETLGNFFAGIMILVYRPFDEGDVVLVAGARGKVTRMTITSTILTTGDNQILIIPNTKVWNDIITNLTDASIRRIDLEFIIVSSTEAIKQIPILASLLHEREGLLNEPQAEVFVGGLDGRGATLEVRAWVDSQRYQEIRRALVTQLGEHFEGSGVELWRPKATEAGID